LRLKFLSLFPFTSSGKMAMMMDTLKDEEIGVYAGDDMLKTIEEIATRSAAERTPEK